MKTIMSMFTLLSVVLAVSAAAQAIGKPNIDLYSVVVFWLMGSTPSGRQACRWLGKQRGADLFCPLPTLEAVVGRQDQRLNQGLRLLTTRCPNGFDGHAPLHR